MIYIKSWATTQLKTLAKIKVLDPFKQLSSLRRPLGSLGNGYFRKEIKELIYLRSEATRKIINFKKYNV